MIIMWWMLFYNNNLLHYTFVKPAMLKDIAIVHVFLRDVASSAFYDAAGRKEVFACFLGNTVSRGPWLHWAMIVGFVWNPNWLIQDRARITPLPPEFCPSQQWASCNHSQSEPLVSQWSRRVVVQGHCGKRQGTPASCYYSSNIKPKSPHHQHHHPPLCSQCLQKVSGSGTCWRPWQVHAPGRFRCHSSKEPVNVSVVNGGDLQ